jgi:hypothetical protein
MLAIGTARNVRHPVTSAFAISALEIGRGVSAVRWLGVCAVDRAFMMHEL